MLQAPPDLSAFIPSKQLLERGDTVVGLDNFNDYYDVSLKEARAAILDDLRQFFKMVRIDLAGSRRRGEIVRKRRVSRKVVHLAAQAGVRYSIENPHSYIESNIVGTLNISWKDAGITMCSTWLCIVEFGLRRQRHDALLHPSECRSPAGVVWCDEESQRAHGAHLFKPVRVANDRPCDFLQFTARSVGLTWRLFMFTKNIIEGKPIDVFNYGNHRRDFTYVDDIVEGVIRTMDHNRRYRMMSWDAANTRSWHKSSAPYRIYNIGNQQPVELMRYIEVVEECVGKKAEKNMLPMQAGDVPDTWADTADLVNDVGYQPSTTIEVGIKNFVDWYLDYYKVDLQKSD